MRVFNILLAVFALVFACKGQEHEKAVSGNGGYEVIGKRLEPNDLLSSDEMAQKFQELKVNDTLRTKFKATVTDVCKVKGCWMKLALEDGKETMVRFKDYAFFMPKDIQGKEVAVNGYAFVEAMSVEDQRHYAKDAGMPKEEIEKITEPKKIYSFEADGVLIEKH
ncbi:MULTISPECIES: DUF4920 domain-containing protein [Zobellia]|uniref:Conserved hypothetical membrane protein n=1 Tax=Zobellia galactanivorans (strain DSM 12802 / CCUG 47099 / CIP 106680 / NCIMB 13871 / Dsij) TaxID=63186 RepID=G0LCJ8_ZOBGA|nr:MULTISPECIES: DUF4920 domain-containing protein [Zobellia]MBU3025427.1 DUF4920 domain-containing protein [Zobellia galactanivorans]OWW25165.1 DUF4920 domain-containing protein [Zobellia sp. OII3]CAZ96967.1 Conserved hypothetical membrane protein [Zobellia galactanivorans]